MAADLKLQVLFDTIDRITGPLKKMTEGSSSLSKAVRETRDRLKDLERQQRKLDVLDKTARDLAENTRQLDRNKDALRALRDQIIATENPSKNLKDSYKAQAREVRALERRNATLGASHQRVRKELERSGVPVTQLTAHQRTLRNQIDRVNTQLTEQAGRLAKLRGAQHKYNQMMSSRGQIAGTGAGLVAGGAAIGAPVLAAIKNFATFEDAMIGVARQVQGARDANGKLTPTYYELAEAIKALSTDARIGLATTDIAALVEAGARMGIQGKDNLLEFARSAAYSATAFDATAGDIGESMARVANLYKIPIANITTLGDTINWLDDNAQSKGDDIIEVMSRMAGISQTVGMSFKDAAALGSTFLSLGSSAEVAATASNALIRELAIAANQPARFRDAMAAIGLAPDAVQASMVKDSTGTILKVLEAIRALPKDNQLAVTTGLFGKEYGDDVAKMAENIGEYRRQLQTANDETARGSQLREAEARADSLRAQWQASINRLFNATATAGETLKGTLVGLMESVSGVLDRLNRWMADNPTLVAGIMKAAGVLSLLVIGAGGLALGFAAVIGPMAVIKLSLAILAPLFTGLMGPIGLVVAAIAGVGVAAYAIYDNWDRIKTAFVDVFKFIGDGIKRYFTDKLQWALDKIAALKRLAGRAIDWAFGDDKPAKAAAPLRNRNAAGTITNTNTITVNAAPGQSPEAVGKEVGRQLDARERAQGTRRRSRYGDID